MGKPSCFPSFFCPKKHEGKTWRSDLGKSVYRCRCTRSNLVHTSVKCGGQTYALFSFLLSCLGPTQAKVCTDADARDRCTRSNLVHTSVRCVGQTYALFSFLLSCLGPTQAKVCTDADARDRCTRSNLVHTSVKCGGQTYALFSFLLSCLGPDPGKSKIPENIFWDFIKFKKF
jgi:hypothetical protein